MSTSGESPAPKPKRPSVSQLNPNQMAEKRANDRQYQRNFRLRTKTQISSLQQEVEGLIEENASLKSQLAQPRMVPMNVVMDSEFQKEVKRLTKENASLKNQLAQPRMVPMNMVIDSDFSAGFARQGLLKDQILCPEGFGQRKTPAWHLKSTNHYPACSFDQVCLNVIENLQPQYAIGETILEFGHPEFPLVLFDPYGNPSTLPLTSGIISIVIRDLKFESVPKRVAITYIIWYMIRWMITRSEEDYYAMPEWIRPRPAQVHNLHSFCVDIIPWPQLRERLCLRDDVPFEEFNDVFYESLSINWPYESKDVLVPVNPLVPTYIINPVFVEHLRAIDNWTLGTEFYKKYPELKGM